MLNNKYCISSRFSLNNGKYILNFYEENCVYFWNLQATNTIQKLEGHEDKHVFGALPNYKTLRIWIQEN